MPVGYFRFHVRGCCQPVSYTHLRAHETVLDLVCRLLLEKKKKRYLTLCTLRIYNQNSHSIRLARMTFPQNYKRYT